MTRTICWAAGVVLDLVVFYANNKALNAIVFQTSFWCLINLWRSCCFFRRILRHIYPSIRCTTFSRLPNQCTNHLSTIRLVASHSLSESLSILLFSCPSVCLLVQGLSVCKICLSVCQSVCQPVVKTTLDAI